jgi:hypothetical protein
MHQTIRFHDILNDGFQSEGHEMRVCHNLQRRPYARPRARTDDQRIEVVGRSISLGEHSDREAYIAVVRISDQQEQHTVSPSMGSGFPTFKEYRPLFSDHGRDDGSLYYSRSMNAALYVTPKTAVNASNAKNNVIMAFTSFNLLHLPNLIKSILLEHECAMTKL